MKWIEVKIVFDHPDSDLAVDLISDLFYDFGLQGVVIDDPYLKPEEAWAEDALDLPAKHAVTGFFPKDGQVDERCRALEKNLARIQGRIGFLYQTSYQELDDQDWAHAWKAYFWPQRIGSHLVVKPTWRDYQPDGDDMVIELDPGMAFGTGTHPTTALCMTMIEKYVSPGDSFLDIGTGSGILMIVAAKLGAGRLCGIDKDEMAVKIAKQNMKLNQVEPQRFYLTVGNFGAQINESYDFIVANIYSHVILELLADIRRQLAAGGIFVGSGIIRQNKNSVLVAMENLGFIIVETAVKAEWVAIVGRLRA